MDALGILAEVEELGVLLDDEGQRMEIEAEQRLAVAVVEEGMADFEDAEGQLVAYEYCVEAYLCSFCWRQVSCFVSDLED